MPIFTDGKIQASGSFFIGNEEGDQHVMLGHMAHTGTLVVSGGVAGLNKNILCVGAEPSFFNNVMSVSTSGHSTPIASAVNILANDIPGLESPNGINIVRSDNVKMASPAISFTRQSLTGAVGIGDRLATPATVFGHDGTDFINCGQTSFQVDGAVDTDDIPTSWMLSLNPGDGSSAFPFPYMHVASTGKVGIGTNFMNANHRLAVLDNSASSFCAKFTNDGNNANRFGIQIQAGADDGSGNTSYVMALDGDGDGVGNISNASGTFSLADLSDFRIKKNIRDTNLKGLEAILAMAVKDFELKKNNISKTGLIAQELKKVYPAAVVGEETDVDLDGKMIPMSVAYSNLVPVLIKSIQELSEKVSELEKKLSKE